MRPLSPLDAERLGPVCTAALIEIGRPLMVQTDYALYRPTANPGAKPTAFASLAKLAARIHADRSDDALELRDDRMMVRGQPEPLAVVKIYARNETSDRFRVIGWAWLRGAGRDRLAAALADERPEMAVA